MKSLIAAAILLAAIPSIHAQDWALKKLEASPRHGEWVTVKNGDRKVRAFIVYPEVKNKATAVLVVHEIFGLSDWVRDMCDQLAAAGYIAIAPDLLSGVDYTGVDGAREAISKLPVKQITADLKATVDYVRKLPAANGKLAVAGFCWGGNTAFYFAASEPSLNAAFVFYGIGTDSKPAASRIQCPVHGFYGENDARVNETIPYTETLMANFGKTFDTVIYPGAGHGFMRLGEAPDATEANKKAREAAWERLKKLLGQL
ncbi:MAG: dienelactone hydrolase family protein [Chthoniobacterales bacterium]